MSQDDETKDRKERERKELKKQIEFILNTLDNTMYRYNNIKDPAIKFTLFVDKLCFSIDIAIGALKAYACSDDENWILDADLEERITKSASYLQNEMNKLIDWIQSPIYSPDHPYGEQLMKQSKESFDKKKNDS